MLQPYIESVILTGKCVEQESERMEDTSIFSK